MAAGGDVTGDIATLCLIVPADIMGVTASDIMAWAAILGPRAAILSGSSRPS